MLYQFGRMPRHLDTRRNRVDPLRRVGFSSDVVRGCAMTTRWAIYRQTIFQGATFAEYEDDGTLTAKPVTYETKGEAERELADSWGHALNRIADPLDEYDIDQFRVDIEEEYVDRVGVRWDGELLAHWYLPEYEQSEAEEDAE